MFGKIFNSFHREMHEEKEDVIVELKQPSMVVNKEGRKMVRMKFFGDDVEKMKDCRRKRKMK